MCDLPDWLPPLIELSDVDGDPTLWLETLYKSYTVDFIENPPEIKGKPVLRDSKLLNGKEITFWHIVEGSDKEGMTGVEDRYSRIGWVKPILEAAGTNKVIAWKKEVRMKNRRKRERIHAATVDFSYLVVIEEREKYFILITAFPILYGSKRIKLKEEAARYPKFP